MLTRDFSCLFLLLFSPLTYGQTPKHRKVTPPAVLFQGIWAVNKDDNAEFWVEGDRLTYVEFADQHLRYFLTPTKLIIYQQDGPDTYRIRKLTRDSLVLVNFAHNAIRLYKRR